MPVAAVSSALLMGVKGGRRASTRQQSTVFSSEEPADYLDDGFVHFRCRGSRRRINVRGHDIAEKIAGILVANDFKVSQREYKRLADAKRG